MSDNTSNGKDSKQEKDKGVLERMAETIDPPGREISDDELIDPGRNIPSDTPETNRPKPAPSRNH